MSTMFAAADLMAAFMVVPAQLPNPAPVVPPGAEKFLTIVGIVKWVAGLSLVFGFFGGLAVWNSARFTGHHRSGGVGAIMMIVSVAGAILFAIGYPLLDSFAASG